MSWSNPNFFDDIIKELDAERAAEGLPTPPAQATSPYDEKAYREQQRAASLARLREIRQVSGDVLFVPCEKPGALRNGAQRGNGVINHAVPVVDGETLSDVQIGRTPALCGTFPSIMWVGDGLGQVTCPRCLKKLGRDIEHAEEFKNGNYSVRPMPGSPGSPGMVEHVSLMHSLSDPEPAPQPRLFPTLDPFAGPEFRQATREELEVALDPPREWSPIFPYLGDQSEIDRDPATGKLVAKGDQS